MHASRRRFLRTSLVASCATPSIVAVASAIDPIQRSGKSLLKLSLAAYSYRKYLDLKVKPKPSMTLMEFADLAAGMGLSAIEPTGYYFADTSPKAIASLKAHCTKMGLDISGTAIANNFCQSDAAKLKTDIQHVKNWTEHASRLGAKTVRIFAGTKEKKESDSQAEVRCVAAIEECCDHAAQFGVILALENHGGVTESIEQILSIVQAVKHPFFGVNWDSGNFRSEDPYADLAKLAPYAVTAQVKTEVQRRGQPKEEADLKRLLNILRGVNYRGYVALEYEGAEEPKMAVPRYIASLQQFIG